MRPKRLASTALVITFVVGLASTAALPGCGESPPPVTQEAVTSKTDTSQFSGMMEQMKSNVTNKKK